MINQRIISVQANLESALRMLRDKRPMMNGYFIWIDALCINQEDMNERSQEVRRMRLIYRLAANVVIWLGPRAEGSDEAMDLVKILSVSCQSHTDKSLGQELRKNPKHLGDGVWYALSRLLERSYWTRMWIIQELCLGSDQTPVLCGEKVVTWQELYAALFIFGKHNIDVVFSCIDRERKDVGLAPFGLNRNKIIHVNSEQQKQIGCGKPQFMPLLDLARKSEASDARDKVYGILGLMHPAVVALVTLDYRLSVEQVYTDFAMQYMIGTHSLEILEQCRYKESALPSWVPDWTNKNHYRLHSGTHSSYHAGGNSLPVYRFRKDESILDLQGVVIDTIDGLGAAYFEYGDSTTPSHNTFQPDNPITAYESDYHTRSALWRTLTGDRNLQGGPAPEEYIELLDLPLRERYSNALPSRGARAFSRFLTQNAALVVCGSKLDHYFTSSASEFPTTGADALERVWRFTRTQRLVTTSSGRIGMAPNEILKGDMACVVPGADVPLLLRPTGDQSGLVRLVGSCYVHGVMDGEVLRDVARGLFTTQTISIC
ncbi:hypothetical protein NX059_008707 [Plenodomus lindquistii]|nr:hypothetical protein NX059_008707 [Plenodomus lindquistii]